MKWLLTGGAFAVGGFLLAMSLGSSHSTVLVVLNHVGFASSFTAEERRALKAVVEPLVGGAGFTGSAPGGPSRWSTKRSTEWQPLDPKLVVEVAYDHFTAGRFRHGTRFLRWRPDKAPAQCTFDQLGAAGRNMWKMLENRKG